MEEEELTDAIYGDLGDFEFGEKLKEQNEEIKSLTERLNQSVVTITDLQTQIKALKKENRQIQKNTSSLLLTAKQELNRKQRDISALHERIDNRVFRRPNRNSVAIQTDVVIHPLTTGNANNNILILTKPMTNEQVEACTNNIEPLEKSNPTYNNRNGISNFRIPKKDPFARHVEIDEPQNAVSVCKREKLKDSQLITISNDQQKKYHIPKKNPFARRFDVHEHKSDVINGLRYENDDDKGRSRSRRGDDRDNRKRSPGTHTSKHRDKKPSCSADDQRRHRHNSGSRRKHSHGRSSSGEKDRYTKRLRSDSNSNHHRSNTTAYCNDEKDRQPKSPRKSNSKSRKNDRNEDMRPEKDSISDIKEKDLEAMLIAQKKILEEIDGKDNKEQRLKENISKEQHARELSPTEGVPEKLIIHQERSGDTFNCTNKAILHDQAISESKDSTSVVEMNFLVDQNNYLETDVFTEILEIPSVTSSLETEIPPEVTGIPISNFNSLSPLRNVSSPVKELTDQIDEIIILPKPSQFECNENSNSQMDIDYELMERTSATSQINLPCEEVYKDLVQQGSATTICPTVNEEKLIDSFSETLISASFIAINNNVPEERCDAENNLNRSYERHILSKNSEYTVQDVGHEVVIFLTKKRKKNKNPKIIS